MQKNQQPKPENKQPETDMSWFQRQKAGINTKRSDQIDVPEGQWAKDPVTGEITQGMGTALPLNWQHAEQVFSASDFIREWLGESFRHVFGSQKRQEHYKLLARVTDVEMETYLRRL